MVSRRVEFSSPTLLKREYLPHHAERMVQLYRGWHAFERSHGGPEIIDFDLSSYEGSSLFESRSEILFALMQLHDNFDDNSGEGEFLRAGHTEIFDSMRRAQHRDSDCNRRRPSYPICHGASLAKIPLV